jgi:NAD(P)-dependent dehydrogenase (short-subunit alcohol dehydrogenase family)
VAKGENTAMHQQKAAIITGASQGIGAGLVEAFLKRGYNVVANSRNITKTNPFPASANLALVDGDIGDRKNTGSLRPRSREKIIIEQGRNIAVLERIIKAPNNFGG